MAGIHASPALWLLDAALYPKSFHWAGERAQWVKALAAKPDKLTLIPQTLLMERRKGLKKKTNRKTVYLRAGHMIR